MKLVDLIKVLDTSLMLRIYTESKTAKNEIEVIFSGWVGDAEEKLTIPNLSKEVKYTSIIRVSSTTHQVALAIVI